MNNKSDWINTEDSLPEFGRTVVTDDNELAWIDTKAGWITFHHGNQLYVPRAAPVRWRYLVQTHDAASE